MNKEDFPIFKNIPNLVYLDNASTSQTPDKVLDAMNYYYTHHKSNIDRGLYKIEQDSSLKYEEARKKVATFVNVENDEVIFTSGSTDASNKLVLLLEKYFKNLENKGKLNTDTKNEILILNTTHNSDLIPLQEYAKRNNLKIKIEDIENILENITERTFIVSAQLVSNVTGKIFEFKNIFLKAKEMHAFSVCDITAAAGHIAIDLKDLGCDAAYFSAHKMCGPTGVGALFIKREYTRNMEPVFFGGNMVSRVVNNNFSNNEYRSDIKLFESGTQNIAGVIGLAAATDYLQDKSYGLGLENIFDHNQKLLKYFYESLEKEENKDVKNSIEIYSEKDLEKNIGIISFNIKNNKGDAIHAHDVAQILAGDNICVRSGKHCADLFLQESNIVASTRISFYFYDTEQDIDLFFISLKKVIQKFKV